MQDRYVADVGDYGKYGLLRTIAKSNLRLGVNWYLTPDENHNADGKHISYLRNETNARFDEELFDALRWIIDNNKRAVEHIQNANILPSNTVFYNARLDFLGEADFRARQTLRNAWHKAALQKFQNSDLVFLDPDNGLQVKSVSLSSKKGNKYIGNEELKDYCKHGKSVIFYNHRERKKENEYLDKFRILFSDPVFDSYTQLGLKHIRGTIRDYIFVIHPSHVGAIKTQFNAFLESEWRADFFELDL